MESRKRTASETHYEYYLGIEADFLTASRYIEFSNDHRNVYSHFFSHMLTTAGAEFESVSKAVAVVDNVPEPQNISEIQNLYKEIESDVHSFKLRTLKGDLVIAPFSDWKDGKNLKWWKAYNNIKHSRHINAKDGSLFNAMHALGALHFVNIVLSSTEPQSRTSLYGKKSQLFVVDSP